MYWCMARIAVELSDFESPEEQEALGKGGDPLRALCQKEVESFDQFLRGWGGDYADGLVKWERAVVEGFLYQKALGRF
jgi:hypothetical protein